jgi:hypothetical protein
MASQGNTYAANRASQRNQNQQYKKTYETTRHNLPENIRQYQDGGRHTGEIVIVTWCTLAGDESGEDVVWGAPIIGESQDLKKKFEVGGKCKSLNTGS